MSELRALARLKPALEPIRDTQATFRALLEAMARPGRIHRLPAVARGAPANPWLAAALITLLDHEVSLAVEPFAESEALERFVRQRTSAARAAVDDADFVVASWDHLDPALPARLRRGSPAYPDESATLVLLVPTPDRSSDAGLWLALDGPGVPPDDRVPVAGLPAGFFEARNQAVDYPRGFDLLLVDAEGRVVALPRSTRLRLTARRREEA